MRREPELEGRFDKGLVVSMNGIEYRAMMRAALMSMGYGVDEHDEIDVVRVDRDKDGNDLIRILAGTKKVPEIASTPKNYDPDKYIVPATMWAGGDELTFDAESFFDNAASIETLREIVAAKGRIEGEAAKVVVRYGSFTTTPARGPTAMQYFLTTHPNFIVQIDMLRLLEWINENMADRGVLPEWTVTAQEQYAVQSTYTVQAPDQQTATVLAQNGTIFMDGNEEPIPDTRRWITTISVVRND
jgi:hypothetical protein